MSAAKKRVPQTSRAILFEQFNDQKDDLAQFIRLNAADNIDSDTMHQKIMKLEVRSFDEFLKKFSPVIYEYARRAPNGEIKIEYKLKKDNQADNVAEINLADSPYFRTLCNIYAKKGESGQANYEFDYDEILQDLLPEAEAKKIRNLRRDLQMLGRIYYEKKDRNEDASRENEKMKSFFKAIADTYSKSELPLLPLRMEDNNDKIKALDKYIEDSKHAGEGSEQPALPALGSFAFDEEGRMTIVPLPAPEAHGSEAAEGRLPLQQRLSDSLVKKIGSDYVRTKGEGNTAVKDLVVSTYTGRSDLATKNDFPATVEEAKQSRAGIMQEQKAYNRIYTSAKNSFIEALQTLAARILNVKVFFDHATAEGSVGGELPAGAGLIIANCDPADLISSDEQKGAFKEFLETVNANPQSKIWFGILPDVKETEEENTADDDEWDAVSKVIDVSPGASTAGAAKGLSMTAASEFLKIMDDAKVLTVFNFKPDKNTNTFATLKPKYINDTKKKIDKFQGKPHAVLAYPNFHLMPGKKTPVVEDMALDSNDREDDYKILIDDVYISSAYVAGGLLVASQQLAPFKKIDLDKRLLKENPNVRIDLENPDISIKLLARFSRELALNWTPKLKAEIDGSPFGFVFSGDPRFNKDVNEYVKNVYIYLARTLFEKNGTYQPVYMTLVKDFIDLYLKPLGQIKRSVLKDFFKDDVASWKEQAKRNPEMLNLILGVDDDLAPADPDDAGKLRMKFGPVEDSLTVDVVDDAS